jgi:putative peptidoglycan lipid II flippase
MDRRGIAAATLVIMLGILTTSVLGFVRSFLVARYFGAHTSTDAFFAALVVPQILHDQLIGGAITAVLIPSFSRLASGDEGELWLVVRTVFVLAVGLAALIVAALELAAHPVMLAVASGFQLEVHAGALPLSVHLLQVLAPTVVFSALSALGVAVLYSLGRRAISSFAPSVYHLGIIGAAVIGAVHFGITALAVGALVGAALQFAVQIPALVVARRATRRDRKKHGQPLIDFRHPAVRRIIRLYLPVAAGLAVALSGHVADINFKSHLPENGGLASMQFATQVVQFPVGFVSAALAFAVLPAISREAGLGRPPASFGDTLSLGMRMSLVVMVPAMVGLLVLATPIAALLYQRGEFTPLDTTYTARAVIGYAPQLPLLAMLQLLVYTFYARHNTLTPTLAGVAGVGIYVALALVLFRFTIVGLALADTIAVAAQMLVLLVLVRRAIGFSGGRRLTETVVKVTIAGVAMAAAAGLATRVLGPAGTGIGARLADVAIPGLLALAAYGAVIVVLRVEEARMVAGMLRRRMRGSTS